MYNKNLLQQRGIYMIQLNRERDGSGSLTVNVKDCSVMKGERNSEMWQCNMQNTEQHYKSYPYLTLQFESGHSSVYGIWKY